MRIKFNLFNWKNFKCNEKINIVETKDDDLNKKSIGYNYLKEDNVNKSYLDNFDFYVENKQTLEKINWIDSIDNIKEVENLNLDNEYPSEFKKNSLYYKSIYVCPSCNNQLLYKIRAYNIATKFKDNNKRLHHIYTCPKCRIFLASIKIYSKLHAKWIGNKLSSYALISENYSKLKYRKNLDYTESLHSED